MTESGGNGNSPINGLAGQDAHALARSGAEHLRRYRELLNAEASDSLLSEAVEAAVANLRAGVDAMSEDDPQRPAYIHNLSLALQSRFDVLDDVADLDAAAAALRAGVDIAAADGKYTALLRYGLGTVLRRTYMRVHAPELLHEAKDALRLALTGPGPDHFDLADGWYEYGRVLYAIAEIEQEGPELDDAVAVFADLVDATDASAEELPDYLDSLASCWLLCFDRRGDRAELAEAVACATRAVRLLRERGAVSGAALANLANALRTRGAQQARADGDLDGAVDLLREALRLPGSFRLRAGLVNNLSATLLERSERTGSLEDLEEAVRLAGEAVAATEHGEPVLADRAHHAAIALRTRYLRLDDSDDLTAAIGLHAQSLDACPPDSPIRPALLSSWAGSLRTRYDAAGDADDLRAAVSVYEEALGALPSVSPDRPLHLNNLGAALSVAAALGEPGASARARGVLAEAVNRAVPGSLERSRALINLGNVLADEYTATRRRRLRARASRAYQEAVEESAGTTAVGPEVLLQAAMNHGDWSLDLGDWPQAATWYDRAFEAIDELVISQGLRPHKESWLRYVQSLTAGAALAALRAGDAQRAVVVAERGRAQLLAQALQLGRLELERLEANGRGDLRQHLEAARSADGVAGSGAPRGLKSLRDEVRAVAGFEDFLAPPGFDDIAARATDRQLLYLLPASKGGLALRVAGTGVSDWVLPALIEDDLRSTVRGLLENRPGQAASRGNWTNALDSTAHWLWDAVVGPSLPHLDPATPVTVIAGGLLGLLPLHAAWTEDPSKPTGRRYADDVITVAYSPSARALRPVQRQLRRPENVTVFSGPGMTNPPLEFDAVRHAVDAADGLTAPAAIDDVLCALRRPGVLHLNCHGVGQLDQPLDSAIALADGELTVRQVQDENVAADLVVLSACETGMVGTRLPDEAVGLPGGLIGAGAAACIASMWAVPVKATAALMSIFYTTWARENSTAVEALRLSHRRLRDATNGELAQLMPTIVTPPEGLSSLALRIWTAGRPFQGAEWWAGFVYVGA